MKNKTMLLISKICFVINCLMAVVSMVGLFYGNFYYYLTLLGINIVGIGLNFYNIIDLKRWKTMSKLPTSKEEYERMILEHEEEEYYLWLEEQRQREEELQRQNYDFERGDVKY